MGKRMVLRNVRLVTEESVDMVIEAGVIAEVTEAGGGRGDRVIDCSGTYVSSGWIDCHVHAYSAWKPYGDDIDEIGVKQGVTTIIDAGSCGADQIAEFIKASEKAKTNVLAYLNISRIGLMRTDECSNLDWLDRGKLVEAVREHRDSIVGLKARISRSVVRDAGIEPLRIARDMSLAASLPLMVHIGSGPPDIRQVVSLLEAEDVITHYLHGKPNGLFDREGKPLQELTDAISRGVHLDVGHGSASFTFQTAQYARQSQVPLGTISTDIYRGNRLNGPVYSLANVMSKFLNLGFSLAEIVDAVTTRPAERYGRPELASMEVGNSANLTLFQLERQAMPLVDCAGQKLMAEQIMKTVGVVRNGEYMACEIRSETSH